MFKFKLKGTEPTSFHLGYSFYRDDNKTLCMDLKWYIERMIDSNKPILRQSSYADYNSPLEKCDHPKLDNIELLDLKGIDQHQSLIRMMQCVIYLGHMDITTAVIMLLRFRSVIRHGYLKQAKRVIIYLER